MAKFKHNKKRNTAFIYESLVIELTKAVLENDHKTQAVVKSLIKENYKKGSSLLRDLRVYQAIVNTVDVDESTAEKILAEAKKQKSDIDSRQLFNEQNRTIDQINKSLRKNFFFNFVPNYKELASVSQIFNTSVPIKSRVLLEQEVVQSMVSHEDKEELLPIDSLTYKVFTQKFNEQYSKVLSEDQKILLEKYISSFKDNGLELKSYLDGEIGRLKNEIKKCFDKNLIQENRILKEKLKKVSEVLNDFASQKPDEEMLQKIISIQSLVAEIKKDVNSD
tara:strand:- start:1075 stop:1908 length:834 start_codon:yes stop_codon:yes gene_type:complete